MVWNRLTHLWSYLRPLVPPLLLCGLVVLTMREPIEWWLRGQERYDQAALREWIREARINQSLPALAQSYVDLYATYEDRFKEYKAIEKTAKGQPNLENVKRLDSARDAVRELENSLATKREEIYEHLKALGDPPTKMYPGQLPLFPTFYRLEVHFANDAELPPISWDSLLPRQERQYRDLPAEPVALAPNGDPAAWVAIKYQLHAFAHQEYKVRQENARKLLLSGLGLLFVLLALTWMYVAQRRERERARQRASAEQQVGEAKRLRLEEELRRQEAERKQEEAERQALELKSQLFANIGIMAGSYAHNIKNLLVRPNDLLQRCLDDQNVPKEQAGMLEEVRHTLGTVTERLQQILQTVRRDPSKSERVRIDLNAMLTSLRETWQDLAREKWKLALELDLHGGPHWIDGDVSHLQQALENLLFNARDATFEMRNHLRDQARRAGASDGATADSERRQALISAAAWRGRITLRSRLQEGRIVLEVQDNGIGMTDEVRSRCLETHFSTKRNNALFAGMSAGMGLGLSFVTVILEHHGAQLEIESQPLQGATFRVFFPPADNTSNHKEVEMRKAIQIKG